MVSNTNRLFDKQYTGGCNSSKGAQYLDVGAHLPIQDCIKACNSDLSSLPIKKCTTIEFGGSEINYKCRLWNGTCNNDKPKLLKKGTHCDLTPRSQRISMLPGKNDVRSCNKKCNENQECVQFALGKEDFYKDRCDLYRSKNCTFRNTSNWKFDIYKPSKNVGHTTSNIYTPAPPPKYLGPSKFARLLTADENNCYW